MRERAISYFTDEVQSDPIDPAETVQLLWY